MTKRGLMYLVGVVVLGLVYYPLRQLLDNDALFFLLALFYVGALRYLAHVTSKRGGGDPEK